MLSFAAKRAFTTEPREQGKIFQTQTRKLQVFEFIDEAERFQIRFQVSSARINES